jgi:hypothetical protein
MPPPFYHVVSNKRGGMPPGAADARYTLRANRNPFCNSPVKLLFTSHTGPSAHPTGVSGCDLLPSAGQPDPSERYQINARCRVLKIQPDYIRELGRLPPFPSWPSRSNQTDHQNDSQIRKRVKGIFLRIECSKSFAWQRTLRQPKSGL